MNFAKVTLPDGQIFTVPKAVADAIDSKRDDALPLIGGPGEKLLKKFQSGGSLSLQEKKVLREALKDRNAANAVYRLQKDLYLKLVDQGVALPYYTKNAQYKKLESADAAEEKEDEYEGYGAGAAYIKSTNKERAKEQRRVGQYRKLRNAEAERMFYGKKAHEKLKKGAPLSFNEISVLKEYAKRDLFPDEKRKVEEGLKKMRKKRLGMESADAAEKKKADYSPYHGAKFLRAIALGLKHGSYGKLSDFREVERKHINNGQYQSEFALLYPKEYELLFRHLKKIGYFAVNNSVDGEEKGDSMPGEHEDFDKRDMAPDEEEKRDMAPDEEEKRDMSPEEEAEKKKADKKKRLMSGEEEKEGKGAFEKKDMEHDKDKKSADSIDSLRAENDYLRHELAEARSDSFAQDKAHLIVSASHALGCEPSAFRGMSPGQIKTRVLSAKGFDCTGKKRAYIDAAYDISVANDSGASQLSGADVLDASAPKGIRGDAFGQNIQSKQMEDSYMTRRKNAYKMKYKDYIKKGDAAPDIKNKPMPALGV